MPDSYIPSMLADEVASENDEELGRDEDSIVPSHFGHPHWTTQNECVPNGHIGEFFPNW